MVQMDFITAILLCIVGYCGHAHRAVIFAIAQLSCSSLIFHIGTRTISPSLYYMQLVLGLLLCGACQLFQTCLPSLNFQLHSVGCHMK